MTCNQIILLFHIKRGSIKENESWGTHRKDMIHLLSKHYIVEISSTEFLLTSKGKRLVSVIEEITKL